MRAKTIALCVALCFVLTLAGCSEELPSVYVQNAGKLMNQSGIAPGDRFGGIVVSEDITQIEKDNEMTVEELLVKAGDDVKEVKDGKLADVAPTILKLMGIEQPAAMTGQALV